MPYRNHRFKDVILPDRMPKDDLSTGRVDSRLTETIGGVYNHQGAKQLKPRKQTIRHRGMYLGETSYWVDDDGDEGDGGGDYITWGDPLDMLQAQVDALKLLHGAYEKFYRMREIDGALQWKMATLMEVDHTQELEHALKVSEIDCVFELEGGWWIAEEPTSQSIAVVAGTPDTLTLENEGDIAIEEAVITVTFTSGTTGTVEITCAELGVALAWTGAFSGATLIIDTQAQTVRRNGTASYAGFNDDVGHTVDGWFYLPPGGHNFVIEITGGNATVSVEYYTLFA